jgi:1-acyl-sn-glycerol-3-phosphate acyltransferase
LKRLARRAFRYAARLTLRGLFGLTTRLHIEGLDNIPHSDAAIIAFNHLGHLDPLLVSAFSPRAPEFIALADLLNVPGTSLALRAYGIIPIYRDEYDRQVIRAALDTLNRGDLLALAPEARQSPNATLEKGREGVAYLALKSGAPVVPVGITGTQNVFGAWRQRTPLGLPRGKRPDICMRVGTPFHLSAQPGLNRRKALEAAHAVIMKHIAQLLPIEYRGYWI